MAGAGRARTKRTRQLDFEGLPVEEQERAERLVLSGGRDAPLGGEVRRVVKA